MREEIASIGISRFLMVRGLNEVADINKYSNMNSDKELNMPIQKAEDVFEINFAEKGKIISASMLLYPKYKTALNSHEQEDCIL
ncbi:MAG: hypothetical protein PHP06_05705 [Clostridia bacterium]|nr:hypothetical protein [Clostridia bacterium]